MNLTSDKYDAACSKHGDSYVMYNQILVRALRGRHSKDALAPVRDIHQNVSTRISASINRRFRHLVGEPCGYSLRDETKTKFYT